MQFPHRRHALRLGGAPDYLRRTRCGGRHHRQDWGGLIRSQKLQLD